MARKPNPPPAEPETPPAVVPVDQPEPEQPVAEEPQAEAPAPADEPRAPAAPPAPLAEPEIPPPAVPVEQPEPEQPALILIERVHAGPRAGFSRSDYERYSIVPRPTPEELKLLGEHAEELQPWWGGALDRTPEPVEGHRFPALVQRRRDGSLWLLLSPLQLCPLDGASRSDALSAVRRCEKAALLKTVDANSSDPAVRQLARERQAGKVRPGTPVALALSGGRAVVALANGEEADPQRFYASELNPLLRRCNDKALLRQLRSQGLNLEPVRAIDARLAELEVAG